MFQDHIRRSYFLLPFTTCLARFSFPGVPTSDRYLQGLFSLHIWLWNATLRDQCGVGVTCGGLWGSQLLTGQRKQRCETKDYFPNENLGGDEVRLLILGLNVSLRINREFGPFPRLRIPKSAPELLGFYGHLPVAQILMILIFSSKMKMYKNIVIQEKRGLFSAISQQ